MLELSTLHRSKKDNKFLVNTDKGEIIIEEDFSMSEWDCPEAFKMAGIKGYEPMTAKELETEEIQNSRLSDSHYILEEKFDGTRALVYFMSTHDYNTKEPIGFCRVFSRRISKKTGFYVENTDSLPHIRENNSPELGGTILDGEMFIEGLPFKEVSSTLNCLWDKAIDRQIEKGFISFHAFDILFYKGVDLRQMQLHRRKEYLRLAVEEANNPFIKEVEYFDCGSYIKETDLYAEVDKRFTKKEEKEHFFIKLEKSKDTYPNLYNCWVSNPLLTPRAYYELIVATGGEGLIVKSKEGKYLHKRSWEYSKIKKFLTKDLIILGFSQPTKEYTGKDVRKWGFWVEKATNKRVQGNFYGDTNYLPVTKFYYYNQVGNLLLGVLIKCEDFKRLPKNKQGAIITPSDVGIDLDTFAETNYVVMEVCECAGFDDETRDYFTRNKEKMVGSVVEVKANEVFKDSGKLRHPRYMRQRFDKSPEQCVWEDHIGG